MSSPKSQATKQRGRRGARKPGGDGWSTAAKLAAAYLDGLRARAHRRYEEHLLDCEACWREVSLARRGRELAESIADTAPAGTREKIRVAVASAATEQPAWVARHHRRHLILATAVPDRSRRARRRRRHVVSLAEQHWRRDRTSINPGRRSGQFPRRPAARDRGARRAGARPVDTRTGPGRRLDGRAGQHRSDRVRLPRRHGRAAEPL